MGINIKIILMLKHNFFDQYIYIYECIHKTILSCNFVQFKYIFFLNKKHNSYIMILDL